MTPEGLIAILMLGGVAWIVAWIYYINKALTEKRAWKQRIATAQAVQQGVKPIGTPMGQAYGSAYLQSPDQLRESGLGLSGEELLDLRYKCKVGFLFLGEWTYRPKGDKGPVHTSFPVLQGPGHAITIAPTRTGKGTCAVIPNLMLYEGSIIVNDIKGENYAVTASWRQSIHQQVYKFAPFDDDGDNWNPFDIFDDSDSPWDDARHMAELLITDNHDKEVFWNNNARNLLTGLILHIAEEAPIQERNLAHLKDLLSQDEEGLQYTLTEIAAGENKAAAKAANGFLRADIKVRSGVLSTLDSELAFLDSERVANCTSVSDFSFSEIKHDKSSIFFVLPPERLRTYAPLMRLFFGIAALELKRTQDRPDWPVLLMLDEFPAMGRMKVIEEEIAFLAGYDVRLWLFAQDLNQLARIYGQAAQSIIANCRVKQFFGVADVETGKLVSAMCGNTTVPNISVSANNGANVDTSSVSISDGQRPLYDPNEVMNLHENMQLLFFPGHQPVLSQKVSYMQAPALFEYEGKPLYDPNPYHR